MRFATDDATLLLAERHGMEIDGRPECRDVWLHRGERDDVSCDSADPTHRPASLKARAR